MRCTVPVPAHRGHEQPEPSRPRLRLNAPEVVERIGRKLDVLCQGRAQGTCAHIKHHQKLVARKRQRRERKLADLDDWLARRRAERDFLCWWQQASRQVPRYRSQDCQKTLHCSRHSVDACHSLLRRAVSDLTLDKLILQEAARGNF